MYIIYLNLYFKEKVYENYNKTNTNSAIWSLLLHLGFVEWLLSIVFSFLVAFFFIENCIFFN